MNYALLDKFMDLNTAIKTASEKDLDEVFQRVAQRANDSEYAAQLEPLQGLCDAITTELRRRAHDQKEEERAQADSYTTPEDVAADDAAQAAPWVGVRCKVLVHSCAKTGCKSATHVAECGAQFFEYGVCKGAGKHKHPALKSSPP